MWKQNADSTWAKGDKQVNTKAVTFQASLAPSSPPSTQGSLSAIRKSEAVVWFQKGNDFYDKGDFDGAITCYDQALSINPNDAATWFNKGLVLKAKGISL